MSSNVIIEYFKHPVTTIVKRLGVVALPVILQSFWAESAIAGFNDPIGKRNDIRFISKMIDYMTIEI